MYRLKPYFIIICGISILVGCAKITPIAPEPSEIIAEPIEGLTEAQKALFIQGDELFAKVYTPEEGLGPIYIQNACESCHVGDGKGHPINTVTRFGRLDTNGFDFMLDQGGPQLQQRSVANYTEEEIPTGYTHRSDRIAPIVIGMGLLAAVSDQDILDMADPNDADGNGVSGRINYILPQSYFSRKDFHIDSSGYYIGRFGKKAKQITLLDQVVFALKEDIGLTSDFDTQDLYNYAVGDQATDNVPDPEVSSDMVDRLVFYMRTLKAPTRRNLDDPEVQAGSALFESIGCVDCHKSTLKTTNSDIGALSNKTFHPYTDLLIHDMGPNLDDGLPEGQATGSEWRTPPLWGLGLAEDSQGGIGYYLHDGRATTIEGVIGYHAGGEADNASKNFFNLSATEKAQVIAFLKSL